MKKILLAVMATLIAVAAILHAETANMFGLFNIFYDGFNPSTVERSIYRTDGRDWSRLFENLGFHLANEQANIQSTGKLKYVYQYYTYKRCAQGYPEPFVLNEYLFILVLENPDNLDAVAFLKIADLPFGIYELASSEQPSTVRSRKNADILKYAPDYDMPRILQKHNGVVKRGRMSYINYDFYIARMVPKNAAICSYRNMKVKEIIAVCLEDKGNSVRRTSGEQKVWSELQVGSAFRSWISFFEFSNIDQLISEGKMKETEAIKKGADKIDKKSAIEKKKIK